MTERHPLRVVARHHGSARVQDLSRELSITIGAASKMVDRLERDGLASRRAHPQDRRSSLVDLTDSGQRAGRTGERVARAVVADLLGDAEDLATLLAGIDRLQARLDSHTAGATAGATAGVRA